MPLEWIALNSVKGLGPARIRRLVDALGSPGEVFRHSAAELAARGLIPQVCVSELGSRELFEKARQQLERATALGITILTLDAPEYPVYLKEIYAPPPVLYVTGDLSVFSMPGVAVVGTRSPTPYGTSVAKTITRELVESGLVIVSGLAVGIDTVAHKSCIESGGRTIAVLGSGIDITYPAVNRDLAARVHESGALVSEFPLGSRPETFNFPRRNRIISGLAAGVLVVEGSEKSGSLITAHYALQQGRDVFAVPGPVTSSRSAGTFTLIRDGAVPARNGSEIAEALALIKNPFLRDGVPGARRGEGLTIAAPAALLGDRERAVYEALGETPRRIDELCEITGKPVMELLELLLNLELKGCARQADGQMYLRA